MRMAERRTIRVIGIAYKDKPDDSSRFLSQLGNPYQTVGMDREGRIALDFGVYGVPETFVIDKQGVIRHKHVGALTPEVLQQKIEPLLKELNA